MNLKNGFAVLLLFISSQTFAQKVDSMFVNLYTDSLKKGTYNYINVDGLLSNGRYLPLDSNHITFRTSYGEFYGNSLWIHDSPTVEKVNITITLKKNPSLKKEFVMYIKRKADTEKLPTDEEIIAEMKKEKKKVKRKD